MSRAKKSSCALRPASNRNAAFSRLTAKSIALFEGAAAMGRARTTRAVLLLFYLFLTPCVDAPST